METVEYINQYADFAAAHGFNTLVLYLEGRVRTESFPFRSQAESYSLREMERVVGHARELGMEVVPVVPALGHCEQFVRCRQLRHLAEERGGRGRWKWSSSRSTFCPSLEETYQFLERYYTELAEVFAGPWWHVGLDESWNLGLCPLCRRRWRSAGLGSIFTEHLRRLHKIVAKLGRRTWIWNDMLELFPDELQRVPRDVVLCHWEYADDPISPEGIQAHLANHRRWDWLRMYEQQGLDALICPGGPFPLQNQNVELFTDYARRHRVLGGVLTQWEGSPRRQVENPVLVAMTGRLWKRTVFDPAGAWRDALEAVLPEAPAPLRQAAGEVLRLASARVGFTRRVLSEMAQPFFDGRPTRQERLEGAALQAALAWYRRERRMHPGAGCDAAIWGRLEWAARLTLFRWGLREFIPLVYDPARPCADHDAVVRRANALRKEFSGLVRELRRNNHAETGWRAPDDRGDFDAWRALAGDLQALWDRARRVPSRRDWLLILRLFVPDVCGWPTLKVSVEFGNTRKGVLETSHVGVPRGRIGGHYDLFIPFASKRAPDGVVLEGYGYGRQGVCFVEVKNASARLVPAALEAVHGPVAQAAAVLRDDSSWAYLGGAADFAQAVRRPELATRRGMVRLSLKRG